MSVLAKCVVNTSANFVSFRVADEKSNSCLPIKKRIEKADANSDGGQGEVKAEKGEKVRLLFKRKCGGVGVERL